MTHIFAGWLKFYNTYSTRPDTLLGTYFSCRLLFLSCFSGHLWYANLTTFYYIQKYVPTISSWTYHNGWIIWTRYGDSYIKIEAIFTLIRIRIPHFCPWKAWKHSVTNLNTGIGFFEGIFGSSPPENKKQKLENGKIMYQKSNSDQFEDIYIRGNQLFTIYSEDVSFFFFF